VPDQQQTTVLGRNTGQGSKRLGHVEPARQRRMLAQQRTLLRTPTLGRELGRLGGTHLGAEQHLIERDRQALNGDAGGARLVLPAPGQQPPRVGPRSVRLGIALT